MSSHPGRFRLSTQNSARVTDDWRLTADVCVPLRTLCYLLPDPIPGAARLPIDRIEVLVTDLTVRVQREISSGAYDTGVTGTLIGKPVLVKIHADGVTGYGQIRPISPGHFIPDTVHSVVAAITEVYGDRKSVV